ncbi:zf-primase domain-containing protein [Pseudozyma hubeiensis]|nr:zf-primase domain-containing protein [Pseudozyma hubeiensis]
MEVTRTASTSRGTPAAAAAPAAPPKHHVKRQYQRPSGPFVDKEQDARREASLLSFAEARAKASSTYSAPPAKDTDFQYPPSFSGDASARGLLEQIKNRMEQRAPKPSNFLQKAKQVQQSLLDKQQQSAELQRVRSEADRREAFRSEGFVNSQYRAKAKSGALQGAFSRAKDRAGGGDDDEVESQGEEDDFEEDEAGGDLAQRDDDLALVERIRPGPRAIPPNPDDPKWELMEPFSGHHLRERKLPHSELKEHLRGRYHVPPSLLYSIARPLAMSLDGSAPNTIRNGDYEVPLDGDWIVIATIVEKSELLVTKGFRTDASTVPGRPASHDAGSSASAHDEDPVLFKDAGSDDNGKLHLDLEPGSSDAFQDASKGRSRAWNKSGSQDIDEEHERSKHQSNLANRSRKFVILKLVDLGVNSTQGDGSGSAGRGDNYLSLIAYESDQVDTSIVPRNNNVRSEVAETLSAASAGTKKWINGSRGAFEMLYKQAEGTLVAIMNPKVLRPWAPAGSRTKSLETKMLRITPRSAEDCLVIGQAADYRRCSAMKANGQRCSNFVDTKARKQTRTTTCDFHLSRHMDELARGRPEFAANSTSRFGSAGGGGASGAKATASSSFPGRRGGSYAGEESAINNITSSYKTAEGSNPFSRAALAKKLNSSFGNVGDGMENNGGQVYVSQSPITAAVGADDEVRASDPSSWKYDVSGRYGRGNTEKQSRLKKQIEEEQLMRKIEARFAPPPARPAKRQPDRDDEHDEDNVDGERKKREAPALPVLPNGTADMINAAYSTLDQRKRIAQQKQQAINAKRRKYTGVVHPSVDKGDKDSEAAKLKFMNLASTNNKRSSTLLGGMPIAGLNRHAADAEASPRSSSDSRSKLLSLAQKSSSNSNNDGPSEPSLKIKRAHRPKLRLPSDEVGRVSKLKVVGGELINMDDFEDDWEDDLGDLVVPSNDGARKAEAASEANLSERIMQLHSQSQARQSHIATEQDDDDSDLEII